jgi:hypothetical protein
MRWIQLGSDIDGSAGGDNLGHSVSLSRDGTTLIVGSPASSAAGTNSGNSKVYYLNGNEWTQKGSTINGSAAGDQSGWSVSIDANGSNIAIGSPFNDLNGSNSGVVRVYAWNGSTWSKKGQDITGELSGDQSGFSVDISDDGNTVIIGAIYNDDNGTSSGHVRVYVWSGSAWTKRGSDLAGEAAGDLSGHSVSGDGNVIAIGAIFNDGGGFNSGQARVHRWNGSSWTRKGTDIDGEASGDQSGFSVSISGDGNVLVVGSPLNDGNGSNSGSARIYFWDGLTWTRRGQDINGEFAEDQSGYSISINQNGSVVAIGAIYNDAAGTNAGHVRTYSWNGTSWVQLGQDIDGENPEDQSASGRSVCLDGEGFMVAIGAPYNDGNGLNSGHVRVFRYTNQ